MIKIIFPKIQYTVKIFMINKGFQPVNFSSVVQSCSIVVVWAVSHRRVY